MPVRLVLAESMAPRTPGLTLAIRPINIYKMVLVKCLASSATTTCLAVPGAHSNAHRCNEPSHARLFRLGQPGVRPWKTAGRSIHAGEICIGRDEWRLGRAIANLCRRSSGRNESPAGRRIGWGTEEVDRRFRFAASCIALSPYHPALQRWRYGWCAESLQDDLPGSLKNSRPELARHPRRVDDSAHAAACGLRFSGPGRQALGGRNLLSSRLGAGSLYRPGNQHQAAPHPDSQRLGLGKSGWLVYATDAGRTVDAIYGWTAGPGARCAE